jgi:hypothetical protein
LPCQPLNPYRWKSASLPVCVSSPPERQAEVLDFVEFLDQRRQATAGLRPIGLCAGDFAVPDNFDAPLPEATLRLFES